MPSLVVPFRGAEGKSRLLVSSPALRMALVQAMLADVVDACLAVGPTFVVAPQATGTPAVTVADPGRGQGAAVRAGLDAAVAAGAAAPLLVVNADLPAVEPRDLLALAGSAPPAGLAVAAARDGTTNALALASAELFLPLYGPGSAARFAAVAPSRLVDSPNLVDDVDTAADLERLAPRLGRRTRRLLDAVGAEAAA
ncbi:MAG TPA: NTP transferase domain-containing protein [Gaiellaceae bacterium]|nr:NTP transferase domain-containing protein [Gaiellaceae bacterium]